MRAPSYLVQLSTCLPTYCLQAGADIQLNTLLSMHVQGEGHQYLLAFLFNNF